MALPWLESLQAATAANRLTEPPLRMAFLFMPNGVNPLHWTPPGDAEANYPITPHLKPVAHLRGDFLLLENLWNERTAGRNGHWPKVPAFLSGGYVQRSTGKDLDVGGTSLDQYTAARIGYRTPLPSIELGLEAPRTGIDNIGGGFARIYGSFISWRDPHTPVPKEIVPQLAFDRLFRTAKAPVVSGRDPDDPAVAASVERDYQSVLDLVLEDAHRLQRRVSSQDRIKLDEYFESVRSVEKRIENSLQPQQRWINEGKLPMERPSAGIPADRREHLRLMMDILLLSFWTDSTRIGTLMTGDAQSGHDYSFLDGVRGSFHGLSHHRNEEDKLAQYGRIIDWHMEQLAYFLERAKSMREGEASLLDNSMFLFGSTLKCGNTHSIENLPLILAGKGKGTLKPGRRVRAKEKTPLCNLYLAMLQRMGIEEKAFGDSTGVLEGLS
jgi:hypothetical protein